MGFGFPLERVRVLSRSTIARALTEPTTSALLVTHAGWFPEAHQHFWRRPSGAAEAIVIVCTQGTGFCAINDGPEFAVGVGDVLIIPARTPHYYGASTDDPWTIWWLHITGSAVPSLTDEAVGQRGMAYNAVDHSRLVHLVDEAIRILERGETPAHLTAAAGCAWHLMGSLGLSIDVKRPPAVEQAIALMRDRMSGTISVAELARQVSLSPSHFAAQFRKSTGTSVLHYFIAMKMEIAREMLVAGHSIAEVSKRLAFSDTFYFSRQFRRFHGVSPSTYRAERLGRDARSKN